MNLRICLVTSRLIFIALVCVVLCGRASAVDGNTKPKTTSQVVNLNLPFTLREGRQVILKREKLRIKFAAVTQDSRCPQDVTCVWAGNAAVQLDIITNVPYGTQEADISRRSTGRLTLNTGKGPSLANEISYQSYKVKLVDLSPYPRSVHRIAAGDYVVTLLVSKN